MNELDTLSQADFDTIQPIVESPADPLNAIPSDTPIGDALREIAKTIDKVAQASTYGFTGQGLYLYALNVAEFKAMARALGHFTKSQDDSFFNCVREFGCGLFIKVFIDRSKLCERVVIGHEEIAEVVIPAHRREIVEWRCGPDAKQVTAPTPTPAVESTEESLP